MSSQKFALYLLLTFELTTLCGRAAACGDDTRKRWTKVATADFGEHGQTLDIYHPSNRQTSPPFKTVLLFHGGCFSSGKKDDVPSMQYVQRLTSAGYAVVSIDYRLADLQKRQDFWPAQVIDAQQAVQWIRAHGSKYKLDTGKLVAMGYSAGATLSVHLGTHPMPGTDSHPCSGDSCRPVDGVIDFFGRMDLTHSFSDKFISRQAAPYNSYPGESASNEGTPDCGEQAVGKRRGRFVAPNSPFYTADVLSTVDANAACTLIVHGTQDRNISILHSKFLYDRLVTRSNRDDKVGCFRFVPIVGAVHMLHNPANGDLPSPKDETEAWNAVCPFLDYIFRTPAPQIPESKNAERANESG